MSHLLIKIIEAACLPANGYSDVDPDEWKRLRHLNREIRDALGVVSTFRIRQCKIVRDGTVNGLAHIPDYLVDSVCIPSAARYGTLDTKSNKGTPNLSEQICHHSIALRDDMITTIIDDNNFILIGILLGHNRYVNDRVFLQFSDMINAWKLYSGNPNLHLSFIIYYEFCDWEWRIAFLNCIVDIIPDNIATYPHAIDLLSNSRIAPKQYVHLFGLLRNAGIPIPADRAEVYEAIRNIVDQINPEVFSHILCSKQQVAYYAEILRTKVIKISDASDTEIDVIHRMLDKNNYGWLKEKYLGKPRLLRSKAGMKLETFARFNRNFTAKEKIEIFHMTLDNLFDICRDPTMTPQLLISTFGLGSANYAKARKVRLDHRHLFDA